MVLFGVNTTCFLFGVVVTLLVLHVVLSIVAAVMEYKLKKAKKELEELMEKDGDLDELCEDDSWVH